MNQTTNDRKDFDPAICLSRKVSIIHRATADIFRKHLGPHDLTNSQVSILFVLSRTSGVSQSRLGKALHLEKSTVHRNLRRLIGKGLVEVDRQVGIRITRAGRDRIGQVLPSWKRAMAESQAILSEDGVNAIDLLLAKLQ